jgi:cytochrome c556
MKRIIAGLALAAIAFSSVYAIADPIADRKALMKENGKIAFGTLAPVVKGEAPFDAAAVNAALAALNTNVMKLDVAALFPAGSETGGETAASPKIWEDMAGFTAAADQLKADVAAAVAANPQDLEALKTQFGAITKNCGTCHETYRIKKG